MRTLFLTAKHIADQKESDEIFIEHVKSALTYIEFTNFKAQKIIYEYLNVNPTLVEIANLEQLINEVEKKPIIPFGNEIKSLLCDLKFTGVTLNSEVSMVYKPISIDLDNYTIPYCSPLEIVEKSPLSIDLIEEFLNALITDVKNSKKGIYNAIEKKDIYTLKELTFPLYDVADALYAENLKNLLRSINQSNDFKSIKERVDLFYKLMIDFIKQHEQTKKPISSSASSSLIREAREMKRSLSEKLYGQDRAIESITDSIKNNILSNTNSPKSTYLFLGPPATGKTYLAQLMSENLKEYKVKKFDMTQYSHVDSGGQLFGTARNWGNAKIGALTSFVKKNPKAIIVLDEFEKANNQVQTNLLSIFEGGYLTDTCGWCGKGDSDDIPWGGEDVLGTTIKCPEAEIIDKVDFTQTIFVITSNLGKELYSDHKFLEIIDKDYLQAESMILDALRREEKQDNQAGGEQPAIVPELISRFSQAQIVLFNRLNYKAYETIADNEFKAYTEAFCTEFGMKFKLSSNYKNFLITQVLSFAPELDARRIKSKIGVNFFDKVTDYIMNTGEDTTDFKEIKISISKEVTQFIKKHIKDDIENEKLVKELFRKNLVLDIEDKFTSVNGILTYKIISCQFTKVKRVKDFSEDGLVFNIPDVSFSDIAGHTKAKTRLNETIKFLKEPTLLTAFDIDSPKGMLLYGPPGTGKTLLAKAFAHEADLPFISTTGTDLLDSERTKKIFAKAKEYAPSIVFIDEIDALGDRNKDSNRKIPIGKLLSEMDGFSSSLDEAVFVIAATNFKESIDPAIIRPGRIELHIEIDNLDKEAREYFINKIKETKPIQGKLDMNKLLMYTAGMTGAQLKLIGQEASIYCIRHGIKAITQEILIEQINTIKYGEKISNRSIQEMLEETAIHEAGHAVLSKILMPHIKIEQITIAPRANTLGFVSFNNEDSNNNMSVQDFKNRICIAMAGRESQIKKYGNIEGVDTGASNDLEQATRSAYLAIAHYGMDEEVGYVNIDGIPNAKYYNEMIDVALQKWLREGKEETKKLITEHWNKIEKLSKLLLEKEVVYEDALQNILDIQ